MWHLMVCSGGTFREEGCPGDDSWERSYQTKGFNVLMGAALVAQWVMKLNRIREDVGSIPGLAQWAKDLALQLP